ncbi:DNA polymerase delta subunit 4 isoform X2 [Dendrobates tinctorius]|uniref:DNA polymerase delta subunit 4 isoform X2 n=1 Tax=Dendrobates tinctorius TaxID=92724 RepID=UPI003CC98043
MLQAGIHAKQGRSQRYLVTCWDKSEQLPGEQVMERKHQLTDYLPVTRRGNKRVRKQKERDDGQRTVNRKAKSASSKQDTKVAVVPGLSPLDELIQFDLDWRFGPCTGITRLERWQRADELGLAPSKNVKDILLAHHNDPQYQFNLWNLYAI